MRKTAYGKWPERPCSERYGVHGRQNRRVDETADAERCGGGDQSTERCGNRIDLSDRPAALGFSLRGGHPVFSMGWREAVTPTRPGNQVRVLEE